MIRRSSASSGNLVPVCSEVSWFNTRALTLEYAEEALIRTILISGKKERLT